MKPMIEKIEGLIAAPFAVFSGDGSLAPEKVPAYADFLKSQGVAGVFVNGSTGEFASLTVPERLQLAECWAATAAPDFRVMIHVGHTCLSESRRMAAHARDLGVGGCATLAPFFFKPTDVDALVAWCAAIAAEAPDLPFFYYHIPDLSGVLMPMLTFLEKAAPRIPNLAGIKFTHDDLNDFQRCVEFDSGRLNILFGRDQLLLDALLRGAVGAVGTTYNYAAPLYLEMIDLFRAGNLEAARRLQMQAADMIASIISRECGMAAFKTVMREEGFDCGPPRLPLRNPVGRQPSVAGA